MKPHPALIAAWLFAACSAPQSEPVAVSSPEAQARLKEQSTRNQDLSNKLEQVPGDLRAECKEKFMPCTNQALEARNDLVLDYDFPDCGGDTAALQACQDRQLVQFGRAEALARYYLDHNQCLDKIMACALRSENQAALAAQEARVRERRDGLGALPANEELEAAAQALKDQIAYLRSTLPPDQDGLCVGLSDVARCQEAAKQQLQAFEREVSKEEGAYNDQLARGLYLKARKTQASCERPELECITASLQNFGENPETRPLLEQNLQLLQQRAHLRLQATDQVSRQCTESAISEHQENIISAYKQYVGQPGTFFRMQLHRAFRDLHRSELDCIQSG